MSVVVEPIIDDELQCFGAIDVEDEEHLIVDDEVNGQDIEVVGQDIEELDFEFKMPRRVAKHKRSSLQGDVDHQAQQGDPQHDLEHTDDHGHHLQQGDMSHHSEHGNVGERGTENRIYLKVEGNNFNPSGASRQLVNIIKKSFSGAWVTWGKIPIYVTYRWFNEFQRLYYWNEEDNMDIRSHFEHVGSVRLSNTMNKAKKEFYKKNTSPKWISEVHWKEMMSKLLVLGLKQLEELQKEDFMDLDQITLLLCVDVTTHPCLLQHQLLLHITSTPSDFQEAVNRVVEEKLSEMQARLQEEMQTTIQATIEAMRLGQPPI
ncbi:uncharacterized protein G2W53_004117 [Senna tora]|uniref:Transposase n=1 Tax=Senna tora TaxID=362788 RepID=A0A834XCL7_9FABA|nr:uncharacterized protein G2W53_004117 [Senna tora]